MPINKRAIIKRMNKLYKFCSKLCSEAHFKGENHPGYIDGGSIRYCSKWNEDLRKRVRDYFENKCVICGKTSEEEGSALCVHHVNYDKRVCCNDRPPLFVALCRSCHVKTNVDREYWENYFEEMLIDQYGNKCYYTKEEYNSLKI